MTEQHALIVAKSIFPMAMWDDENKELYIKYRHGRHSYKQCLVHVSLISGKYLLWCVHNNYWQFVPCEEINEHAWLETLHLEHKYFADIIVDAKM